MLKAVATGGTDLGLAYFMHSCGLHSIILDSILKKKGISKSDLEHPVYPASKLMGMLTLVVKLACTVLSIFKDRLLQ